MNAPAWVFWPHGPGFTAGSGSCLTSTSNVVANTTTANFAWLVRLSDGSILTVQAETSLEAQATVEAGERHAPLIGQQPRRVVEVTSA